MSEKRISVRLKEEQVAWIDANYQNRSGFIRDLIDSARTGGNSTAEDVIRRYHIEQLRVEKKRKRAELESTEERLQELEQLHETSQEQREILLEEARDTLEDVPHDTDNPAIRNWADKLDMSPAELLEEL